MEELLRWDIVITSHQFIRQRYKDIEEHEAGLRIAHVASVQVAKEIVPKFQTNSIPRPLHNNIYAMMGRQPIVILDESHHVKNTDTVLARALRAMPVHTMFLLSGTPAHNRWTDLYGQISLLPGNPFANLGHFQHMFTGKAGSTLDHPDKDHMALLTRIMAGIMVARPKEVLARPKVENRDVPVNMRHSVHAVVVAEAVAQARNQLRISKFSRRSARTHILRAMQLFSKAQMIAASPIMWKANERMQQDQEDDKLFENTKAVIQEFLDTAKLSNDIDLESLSTDQFKTLVRFAEAKTRKKGSKKNAGAPGDQDQVVDVPVDQQEAAGVAGGEAQVVVVPDDQDEAVEVPGDEEEAEMFGSGPQDFQIADETAQQDDKGFMAEEDFIYAEDSEDETYDPNQGNDIPDERSDPGYQGSSSEDSDDEDMETQRKRPKPQNGRSNAAWTTKWQNYLAKQDESTIMSPRVAAVIKQVREIRQEYPHDKIIVSSRLVLFLDMMQEALSRDNESDTSAGYDVAMFNGTVEPDDQADILSRFNDSSRTPNILLLSAASGGTGLNITGANHLIICEPSWSPGSLEQLVGRVNRMPQEKVVYIYDVFAELSAIDTMMRESVKGKKDVRRDLMAPLRRDTREPFILPYLPTKEDLGFD